MIHHQGVLEPMSRFRILVPLLAALLIPPAALAEVSIGDTEARVLEDLGPPTGTITAGPRKRLTYAQGAVTLVDGRVTAFDDRMARWLELRRQGQEPPPVPPPSSTTGPQRGIEKAEVLVATGHVRAFRLQTRLQDDPAKYLTGEMRRNWVAYLASDRSEPNEPAASLAYPPGSQAAYLYVPDSYNGTHPFGLYVDLRPGNAGGIPPGYDAICNERHLIWVSPHRAGNETHTLRRCMLALDAMASVRRIYRIDERRIFAGGFSGGGLTASRLAILYPEYFRGLIVHARGVYLLPVRTADRRIWQSNFPFLSAEQLKPLTPSLRVAFVTGPGDPNQVHVQRSVTQWNTLGFATKGFDVPDLGHADAPAPTFAEALAWIEGGN